MAKFKIEDKVKVVKSNREHSEDDLGAIGTIVKKPNVIELGSANNPFYDYFVDFGEKKSFTLYGERASCRFYNENELELVEEAPAQNWKLVILPNGDTTNGIFYQNGKVEKTVEVKRYFKDEYSPKAAVYAIFNKLFGKCEEKKPEGKCDEKKFEFPWDKFIRGEVAARFGNAKDFKNFLKKCEKLGLEWNHGEKPTKFGDWCENRTLVHNAFPKNHPFVKLFDLNHLSQGKCAENYENLAGRKIPVIDWKVN